ncbi:histidine triad nucleotide-binding protein [Jatrophihabitans sp. DSM 45814]
MNPDCLFCKIVAGEIPATIVYDDAGTLAFADLNPQAPTHVLVVPKQHFVDLTDLAADPVAAATMLGGIRGTVTALGVTAYRTVFNTGAAVGQSVFHVHAHVLAGRAFTWPPG